jgi:hypothetical protein
MPIDAAPPVTTSITGDGGEAGTAAAEVPGMSRWPSFRIGSALLASGFAEDVEFAATLPPDWTTNVLERPLFALDILVVEPRRSLWDKLAQLRATIPAEAQRALPRDAARQLDKYLYGSSGGG